MPGRNKSIHFPGLNGLRAIAALTVIVLHLNQFLPIIFKQDKLFAGTEIASLSVILFFVLSGFLITYLLLEEKQVHNTISLKSFYLRRILRIWPPYYLTLGLSILLFSLYKWIPENPGNNFTLTKSSLLFFLMLPNINSVFNLMLTPLRPFWSIGAEEQFYVIWPLIIKKSNKTFRTIILFILAFLFLEFLFHMRPLRSRFPLIFVLLQITPIHIMAFGALGAVWVRKKSKILNVIYNPLVQCLAIVMWAIAYFKNINIPIIKNEVFAVFFLIIILNVATNSKSIIKLNGKIFDFFGRISYGLYVYHMLIIVIAGIILKNYSINHWILLCVLLPAIILFASLSYFKYEKYFLKLKGKFAKIESSSKPDELVKEEQYLHSV